MFCLQYEASGALGVDGPSVTGAVRAVNSGAVGHASMMTEVALS